MAEQILMFRKTVDNLTWAILGDTVEGEDFLNWDNEHPSKITLRIFSKDDQELDAVMSSLNNTVIANFDQEDWFDCLFHTIYWYGIDITDPWYDETTRAEITDEWLPVASTPTGMSPDPFYGNDDPTINGEWEYFKFLDYSENRNMSTTNNYLTISGVLGLSHTGTGDPDKLALFSMSMNFNNLENCKYSKNVSYVDVVGGGSMEKTVDRLFAEEWTAAVVNGNVTKYDPDEYVENKKCKVLAKGFDTNDTDLAYIKYEASSGVGPNYATFMDIVNGTNFHGYLAMNDGVTANPKDMTALFTTAGTKPISLTKFKDNVYVGKIKLLNSASAAAQNILAIYSPEYDMFSIYYGPVPSASNASGLYNSCVFGKIRNNGTSKLATADYEVIEGLGVTNVIPTKALINSLLEGDNYAIGNKVITASTWATNYPKYVPTFNKVTNLEELDTEPVIETKSFVYVGDYDAHVNDYEMNAKTINRLYAEEWEALAVGSTGTLYDATGYEGKPTDTVTRIGTSIDTAGVKFVQFSGDVAYAYIKVGEYDAVIMSFTKHTCSTGGPSANPFTPDSEEGDLWIDDDGITWEVTAKEEADGKVYMEITRDTGDWGAIGNGYELYSKIISGDTDGISTLIPDEIDFVPSPQAVAQKVESYDFYPGVSDPLLKPASSHVIESVSGKYVITRPYTAAEMTEMGISITANGLWANDGDLPSASLDSSAEYMSFMRRAYMYDTHLHVKMHIYNATLNNGSSQTLSHISPANYAALFSETSLSAVAIKAIANKHSKTVEELMSSTYKVWEDEDLYIFRISDSYYYSVLKNPPFNDIYINTATDLTTAYNTLKGVGYYLYPMGISSGTWETYWYNNSKEWNDTQLPVKYFITVVSDVNEEFPDLQTAASLNGLSGFLPNSLNTGTTFSAPPYARKLKVLSKTDSGVTTTLKCQASTDDDFNIQYTAPVYVQVVFDKVTMPTTNQTGYTIKSIDVSNTPF